MSNINDVSFKVDNNKFNYRVCAIIINDDKILALKDEVSPYYYLPGGRVQIGETAEEALLFSPKGLGSLNKILVACSREDMLDFGDGKKIKK